MRRDVPKVRTTRLSAPLKAHLCSSAFGEETRHGVSHGERILTLSPKMAEEIKLVKNVNTTCSKTKVAGSEFRQSALVYVVTLKLRQFCADLLHFKNSEIRML